MMVKLLEKIGDKEELTIYVIRIRQNNNLPDFLIFLSKIQFNYNMFLY